MFNACIYSLYWTFGLSLLLMEYLNSPKQFSKYKIQPGKSALEEPAKIKKVFNRN